MDPDLRYSDAVKAARDWREEERARRAEAAELAFRNRRILAERGRWPAGALEACEAFDARHPQWSTMWSPETTARGFEHPAGFRTTRVGEGQQVCAETIEDLAVNIQVAPEGQHWSLHKVCCLRRRLDREIP